MRVGERPTAGVNGRQEGSPLSDGLARAMLRTVAYADVFDYPLRVTELHRYLMGHAATLDEVSERLRALVPDPLSQVGDFLTLRGRERIIEIRRRRERIAGEMWPRAIRWGETIARLPFVRMVAVTGALAVDNVEADADMDYLIVTEPGRLWLCRALVIALVRVAEREGDVICPNYFLSERALLFHEHNFFTAREVAQMVPLAGRPTYRKIRRLNEWTRQFLPNAGGPPRAWGEEEPIPYHASALTERLMRSPLGAWLDGWEMARKIRKFRSQYGNHAEAAFAPDWCKGHFDGHGHRILSAYDERLRRLEGDE